MKYSEFNREVSNLGYMVSQPERNTYIECDDAIVAQVSRLYFLRFSTNFAEFSDLKLCDKNKIVDLCVQLAKTPLAEREEEKRYRLQYNVPPLLARKYANPQYLYIRRMDGYEDISFDLDAGQLFQTIFTESEIAEMDITGFEKVEVSE